MHQLELHHLAICIHATWQWHVLLDLACKEMSHTMSEPLLAPTADEPENVPASKKKNAPLPLLGSTKYRDWLANFSLFYHFRFNFLFFKRLWKILRVFFPSVRSWTLGFFIIFLFIRASGNNLYKDP